MPWLTASEFSDQEATLQSKIKQLGQLFRMSKKTVIYTGAGISASKVGQAARSDQNIVGWKVDRPDRKSVRPTFTHYALTSMVRAGMIHSWIQQNHDGLPQKAGCPQEAINEIHGSWFDPSNPVLRYSGDFTDRDYERLQDDAETADLILVLGSSLSGLTADQVATELAFRRC
jgi:NAD-dependent SIR2 family protein deacetylase